MLYALPHALKQFAIRDLVALCKAQHTVVLTYDDGPSFDLTPKVLQELQRYNVRATFFPSGKNVVATREILDLMCCQGHEIGCHAYSHRNAWNVGPIAAWMDARNGFRALSAWVSTDGLFRPPNGKIDLFTWLMLRISGATLAWWTVDSGDTRSPLPNPTAVARAVGDAGGAVVLMHDLNRGAEQNEYVLELTRALLEVAHDRGMVVIPLGVLLCSS